MIHFKWGEFLALGTGRESRRETGMRLLEGRRYYWPEQEKKNNLCDQLVVRAYYIRNFKGALQLLMNRYG